MNVDVVLDIRLNECIETRNEQEHCDATDFMAKIAENCALWDGRVVRADTPEHFVSDLVKIGFLEPA